MRRSSILFKAAVGAAGMVMLSAGSAMALSWNSSSSPLTVSGYGSTGKAYGSWVTSTGSDGTRSRLSANLYYTNADNHKVYATLHTYTNAGLCVAPQYTSCSAAYYAFDNSDTAHSNVTKSWVQKSTSTGLTGSADFARAGVQVKLDIPLRSDSSSGTSWTNGVKY